MLSGAEMVVRVRRALDAGTFTTNAAGQLAVDQADPAYTDAEIAANLTTQKRELFRKIASRASDNFITQQDVTYPGGLASARLAPPGGLLSRPIYAISRVEDTQTTTAPWPITRANFNDLHLYRSALGYPVYRRYAERGGNLYLAPTPQANLVIRIYYIPEPFDVEVTDKADDEVPPVAVDWLIATAAMVSAEKFGKVPQGLIDRVARLDRDTMAALLSREEGSAYGRWSRGGHSTGLE